LIRSTKSTVHGGRGSYDGFLKSIESLLGSSGFAVGNKLSIIDLELANLISWIGTRDKDVTNKIAGFENLKKSIAAAEAA
jgi:glutathione S-transferase